MADPIKACLTCMNPIGSFPSIDEPGLPTMIAGTLGATLAIILYVKKYLPPSPLNVPKPPLITLFVDAFTAAAIGMPAFESFTLDVPGVPKITIPGSPAGKRIDTPGWNPGFIKLMEMGIALPYLMAIDIFENLLKLQIKIPDKQLVIELIASTGLAVGLPAATTAKLAGCLAESIVSILKV